MGRSFFDAVRAFYQANRNGLLSYANSLARDPADAEDLVQAAVLGLLNRGRAPREMRSFLFRSVRNAAIDGHRRSHESALAREDSGADAEAAEQSVHIRNCIADLAVSEREIVILKAVAGLSFREIAMVTKRNRNTVASQYRRALERLRSAIGEDT